VVVDILYVLPRFAVVERSGAHWEEEVLVDVLTE
jgi:hypothetical protein